ncbi:MAG: multicopper oxidase domain-containing protein [Bradyrhizobium sp.]|nr:multicopper oxidase domain-containing protein [Bradyrhizobium sp.]
MPHPFHVYAAMFRVLTLEGALPRAHLAGWKDLVLVEGKAELLVSSLSPREHPFMYHCHILEHEDAGMMGQYTCT